jgi:TonB family protein
LWDFLVDISDMIRWIVLLAVLMFSCSVGTMTQVDAQTVGDCQSLVSAGQWQAADEACEEVLHVLIRAEWSQGGEYCDTCDKSLSQIPTPYQQRQIALGYSLSAEAEAIVMAHFGHIRQAVYWMQQASTQSRNVDDHALSDRENTELALLNKRLAQYVAPVSSSPARVEHATAHNPPKVVANLIRCTDSEAHVIGDSADLDYPDAAREAGAAGTTIVKLQLSSNGDVLESSIYHSSGYGELDASALASARATKYAPAYHECHPVAGTFLFKANFNSQ